MDTILISLAGIAFIFSLAFGLTFIPGRRNKLQKKERNYSSNRLNDNSFKESAKKEKLRIPGYYEEYLNNLEKENFGVLEKIPQL